MVERKNEFSGSFGSALSMLCENGGEDISLEEFRDISLNSFITILGSDKGFLALFDKAGNEYEIKSSRGFLNNQIFSKKYSFKESINELLKTSLEPLILDHFGKVEILKEVYSQLVRPKSFLAVPFFFGTDESEVEVSGVYFFFDKKKEPCLFKRDVCDFLPEDTENSGRFLKHVLKLEKGIKYVSSLKESLFLASEFLVSAVEVKLPHFENHSRKVLSYCKLIAQLIGIEKTEALFMAATFHDIGIFGVDPGLLVKTESLSRLEKREMQSHVVKGVKYLRFISLPWEVEKIVYHHHERYDGFGYPDHLKGEDIPLESRVIAVADCYDALVSSRPYRKAFSFKRAVLHMRQLAGTQLDPDITYAFLRLIIKNSKIKEERSTL